MRFSLISPTFDRPEEVKEFISSVSNLDYPRNLFEVILADGTPNDTLRPIIEAESKRCKLKVMTIFKEYLPVSEARNLAAEKAQGEYLIFLDSDCIIPLEYLKRIDSGLLKYQWDAFGGPDSAPPDFNDLQKAISFSMTSFWTTGGIRGKKISTSTYYPRGFNMGVKKDVFKTLKGFDINFKTGEDVEFSIRLVKSKYRVGFIPEAVVYHKRRSNLLGFYNQVKRFGGARWHLSRRHKGQLKITHMFPVFFIACIFIASFLAIFQMIAPLLIVMFYLIMPFFLSGIQNKSVKVGLLSICSTSIMMLAYAKGFLEAVLGGGSHLKRG